MKYQVYDNINYKTIKGKVLICQTDDVMSARYAAEDAWKRVVLSKDQKNHNFEIINSDNENKEHWRKKLV